MSGAEAAVAAESRLARALDECSRLLAEEPEAPAAGRGPEVDLEGRWTAPTAAKEGTYTLTAQLHSSVVPARPSTLAFHVDAAPNSAQAPKGEPLFAAINFQPPPPKLYINNRKIY